MNKQHRLLALGCLSILVAGLALWPGGWSSRAYANVTLVNFEADSLPGQPEVYIIWETATEIDTVGFFIQRSNNETGPFVRVSEFWPSDGDDVTGAEYSDVDDTTTLNMTYYYRLEVVNTDQTSDFHGPIKIVAGASTDIPPVTDTFTPTSTPTRTPTPTATATTRPDTAAVNPTTPSTSGSVATPRPVTGATITPQPTSASSSSNPAVATATPSVSFAATGSPPPASNDAPVPSLPDAVNVATAVPPLPAQGVPLQDAVSQAPAPTLVPTDAIPAMVAPVVIATEAAPPAAPANNTNGDALILILAAVLFLGLAFVILRQAR